MLKLRLVQNHELEKNSRKEFVGSVFLVLKDLRCDSKYPEDSIFEASLVGVAISAAIGARNISESVMLADLALLFPLSSCSSWSYIIGTILSDPSQSLDVKIIESEKILQQDND